MKRRVLLEPPGVPPGQSPNGSCFLAEVLSSSGDWWSVASLPPINIWKNTSAWWHISYPCSDLDKPAGKDLLKQMTRLQWEAQATTLISGIYDSPNAAAKKNISSVANRFGKRLKDVVNEVWRRNTVSWPEKTPNFGGFSGIPCVSMCFFLLQTGPPSRSVILWSDMGPL